MIMMAQEMKMVNDYDFMMVQLILFTSTLSRILRNYKYSFHFANSIFT